MFFLEKGIIFPLLHWMVVSETEIQEPRVNTIHFKLLSDLITRGEECIEAIDEDETVIFVLGEVSILKNSILRLFKFIL